MNQLMTDTDKLISKDYETAIELHNKILANGQIAAQAIVDFSLELKEMRDKSLYNVLGYDSFDEYVEKAVGIKKRQAYNYIRVIERFGIESMTEHAHLGITKLQLIANVAAEEREEFIESKPVADMSTRQLEEAIADLHKAREQISFLETELETAKQNKTSEAEEVTESESLKEEYNQMAKEYEDFKAELEERKKQEKENVKKAKETAEAKAMKDLDEAVRKSREEGRAEATTSLKQSLSQLEQEKARAIEKAQELEKQMAVANEQSSVLIAFLFEQIRDAIKKITDELHEMDQDNRLKFSGAVSRFLSEQAAKIKDEGGSNE